VVDGSVEQTASGTGNHVQIGNVGGSVSVTINKRQQILPLAVPDPPALAGLRLPPSTRLHPRWCPVGLVGRETEQAELQSWMTGEPEHRLALRVVAGQGGSGKTRLALDLCRNLPDGWASGFLHNNPGVSLETLATLPVPCLVVMDYAETRTVELEQLLTRCLAADNQTPLRIVLLARQHDTSTGLAAREETTGEYTNVLLYNAAPPLLLDKTPLSPADRQKLFRNALSAFNQTDDPHRDLSDDAIYALPLMILIEALLGPDTYHAIQDAPAKDHRKHLLDAILEHERNYWSALTDSDQALRDRIIAATTLSPTPNEESTAAMLTQVVRDLAGANPERLGAIARWAQSNYTPDHHNHTRYVAPVEPDLIGEHLIASSLATEHSWTQALQQSDTTVTHTLRVLQRLTTNRPNTTTILNTTLETTLIPLVQRSITQVTTSSPDKTFAIGELLATPLTALLQTPNLTLPLKPLSQTANIIQQNPGLAISPLALELTNKLVTQHRTLAKANPAVHLPNLASSLNNLSVNLGATGRRKEALTASEEATKTYRELTEANPAAHLPNLAISLNNLSADLGETGRQKEALTASEEATKTYRRLAKTNPAAHLPNLIISLRNLADILEALGRTGEMDSVRAEIERLRSSTEEFEG